jgi:hypothetical protein
VDLILTEDIVPGFGDHVRIRPSPETEALGIAGLDGLVFGESKPSSSGVEVVGLAPDDYVLNVFIESRDEDYWLRPELVEFLDHAPGGRIELDGVPYVWEHQADGSWTEFAKPAVAGQPAPVVNDAEPDEPRTEPLAPSESREEDSEHKAEEAWVDRSLQRPVRIDTPLTRFLAWLENFLPRLG